MRPTTAHLDLSRRERQIMEAIYRLGSATVSDVMAEMPDPPSYSAVRAMIGKLEAKGLSRAPAGGSALPLSRHRSPPGSARVGARTAGADVLRRFD